MSDRPQGPGWWQASDLKWYPPEKHANYEAPPSTPGTPPTTKGPAGRSKVWFILAGIAVILFTAALVAGRVLLGTFLPGLLLVGAIALIGATLAIRSGHSVVRKAMTVTAIMLVVAVAIPASSKVGYPVYHHFFAGTSTSISSAPSSSSSEPAPSSSSEPTPSSSRAPSGQESGGPSVQASAGVTSGILAVSGTPGSVFSYGFIDPNSGHYSSIAKFDVSKCVCSGDGQIYLSPDFKKFAFTKNVDGHQDAGWTDTSGNFTDATPHANPGTFGGRPQDFIAIGFDGAGNFYYQSKDNDYFKLSAGSTSNAEKILHDNRTFAYLSYDGTVEFPIKSCIQPIWAGPNKMLDVRGIGHTANSGPQIYKADAVADTSTGCFKPANPVPVLPSTNTATVENAVSNRDGTQVAFKLDNQAGGVDLYVSAAEGGSEPKKLTLSNINTPLATITLLNWL
jgi:hypothetical protein